ncbi:hypothetical protein BJY00DRAFT_271736 [Aspergillus carlsbadensis]|nr:hypothetical protein BJY00DRAFT_271736 [Aspergillus carlsbadensis]
MTSLGRLSIIRVARGVNRRKNVGVDGGNPGEGPSSYISPWGARVHRCDCDFQLTEQHQIFRPLGCEFPQNLSQTANRRTINWKASENPEARWRSRGPDGRRPRFTHRILNTASRARRSGRNGEAGCRIHGPKRDHRGVALSSSETPLPVISA